MSSLLNVVHFRPIPTTRVLFRWIIIFVTLGILILAVDTQVGELASNDAGIDAVTDRSSGDCAHWAGNAPSSSV